LSSKLPAMREPSGVVWIGRRPGLDITLDDASVSTLHAEVWIFPDNSVFVVDCRSSNGTFLVGPDGQPTPISQAWVKPTDVLLAGRKQVEIRTLFQVLQNRR